MVQLAYRARLTQYKSRLNAHYKEYIKLNKLKHKVIKDTKIASFKEYVYNLL